MAPVEEASAEYSQVKYAGLFLPFRSDRRPIEPVTRVRIPAGAPYYVSNLRTDFEKI